MNIIVNNTSMQPIYEQIVEQKKEVERDLDAAIRKGKSCGMSGKELSQLFDLLMEEN